MLSTTKFPEPKDHYLARIFSSSRFLNELREGAVFISVGSRFQKEKEKERRNIYTISNTNGISILIEVEVLLTFSGGKET